MDTVLIRIHTKLRAHLLRLEKYTKTDMVYLFRGGSWLTLGQIGNSLISFILSIIFANFLAKEVYGTYQYVLSVVGILSVFTLSGMNTAVVRSVAKGFDRTVKSAFWIKLRWGILGSLAGFALALYYAIQGNTTLAIAFLISAMILPLHDASALYSDFLLGKKQFQRHVARLLVTRIAFFAAIVLLLQLSMNVLFVVATHLLLYTALQLFFFRSITARLDTNAASDRDAESYGKHLSIMNVVGIIATNLDRLVVFYFLGSAQLAIYTFAFAPVLQIKSLLKSVESLVAPKFPTRDLALIRQSLVGKIARMGVFIFLVSLIYTFLAPFFFRVFYPQYTEAVFYSQLLVFSLLFYVVIFPQSALEAHAKVKELYILKTAAPVLRIGLLLTLGYFFGILGVVFTLLVAPAFRLALALFLFYRLRI